MADITLNSGSIEESFARSAKRTATTIALALGTAASGYAAYRLLSKRSSLKAAQKNVEHWLGDRVGSLQHDLHLPKQQSQWLERQLVSTTRSLFRIAAKAQRAQSGMRDMLHLIAERKFLALKLRVHNRIELKAEVEIDSLHKFYGELWARMFPSVTITRA